MPTTQLKERSSPPPRPTKSLRTLVLNADFRPLTTWPLSLVDAREAVSSLWRDRVYVVDTWADAFYRSPSITIQVPKAVALREYRSLGATTPKFCRKSVFLRDHYTCQYCGERFTSEELNYDHVRPRARGGRTEWANIATACFACNARKADHTCAEVAMWPRRAPRAPTAYELLEAGLEFLPPDVKESFGEYLYWNGELEA